MFHVEHTKERDTMETKTRATVRNSHRVVVRTKYHGPTTHLGSRISVTHGQGTTGAKRMYVGWDHSLDSPDNHCAAIQAYLDFMGWDGEWVVGADDTGYFAVQAGR